MARWFESRPPRNAAVVVFTVLGAVGFLPLFGGPGYEHSIASGLVLPVATATAVALELSAASDVDPLAAVGRGVASGAVLAAVAFATALFHGLRVGICDLVGGLVFFLLTAGMGALLAGVWGAAVAEVARRRRRRRLLCVLLSVAAPLAGIAVTVARFYATPMIFAYDPFFGFFSGALYDTIIDVRTELWTYRAGTAATIASAAFLAAALRRDVTGDRLRVRSSGASGERGRTIACIILGIGTAGLSAAVGLSGPRLGHWQSAETIAAALGARSSGARCDVVYPDSLLDEQARLLVRDCEEELAADEARWKTHLAGRLTVYVFSDADQKRRLMGAAETSIAKPWLRQVYVQWSPYPHPLLGHEIAHVVAGSFAPAPFHVGGGVWPNPGLIEGLAVATAPDDDDLTSAEWARAMLDLGILPPPRDLFSLRFLGQSAAKSYTAAAAFVGWIDERWGADVVRAWYGGASLEKLTGRSWNALDEGFRDALRAISMPPDVAVYARAKFQRPSVWARKCPHVVDALDAAADRCRGEQRFARAVALYDRAIARDPHDFRARFGRAWTALRADDAKQGRDQLEQLAHEASAPQTWRDRADEALADDDLAVGRVDEAERTYDELVSRVVDEDFARTIEVKSLAARDPLARSAIVALLIGQARRPVDPWIGALALGRWLGASRDPLAEYVAAKNLASRDDCRDAMPWLEAAPAGSLTPRVRRELLRVEAVCACALDRTDSLAGVRAVVDAPDSPFGATGRARREALLRLITRCEAGPRGTGRSG